MTDFQDTLILQVNNLIVLLMTRGISVVETDYKALCKELFGTTEETKIRELAAKWKKK